MTMKVEQRHVTVGEVYDGYVNDDEEGVSGYGGRLDIRPRYQREFVYGPEKRAAVVESVLNGLPLNVMYWARTGNAAGEGAEWEVLDGQQRTLSLMEYIDGGFSVEVGGHAMYFSNLPADLRARVMGYQLYVYTCEGTDSEKLAWFRTINIAGERLTDQELRNAVYSGPWVSDAKRYFSKTDSPASRYGSLPGCKGYMAGNSLRQELLETAVSWIADRDGTDVDGYMSAHQHDRDARSLWRYFTDAIDWAERVFTAYHSQMRGLPWGLWYNRYGTRGDLDSVAIAAKVEDLFADAEVKRKAGIYEYVLTGDERHLSLRTFGDDVRETVYARQTKEARRRHVSNCPMCAEAGGKDKARIWAIDEMQADHIVPWSKGGRTVLDNCQMLCKRHNLLKSDM